MDQLTKSKAAVYRFFKHVKIVDGKFETDLKSGDQIHVSSAVYVLLKNNLYHMNKDASAMKKKGKAVQIVIPDSVYFEQLLN